MVVVTSLGPPEEGIHHKEEGTTTYVNDKCLGKGTFYISESRVSWVGDAGHKFSLEYPHISLHAISRVRTTALPIFNPLFVLLPIMHYLMCISTTIVTCAIFVCSLGCYNVSVRRKSVFNDRRQVS